MITSAQSLGDKIASARQAQSVSVQLTLNVVDVMVVVTALRSLAGETGGSEYVKKLADEIESTSKAWLRGRE